MNSRSKKYLQSRKEAKGDNKKSATTAGNKTVKNSDQGSALINQDQPGSNKNFATQDDTGGGNDSGKRADDN